MSKLYYFVEQLVFFYISFYKLCYRFWVLSFTIYIEFYRTFPDVIIDGEQKLLLTDFGFAIDQ